MFKKIILSFAVVCMGIASSSYSYAAPHKLNVACLTEHEAFILWYAKENNWDKEANLDINMLRFTSGKEIVNGKRAYDWDIASVGAVPALTSALADESQIIALIGDESPSNIIYAPTESKLFESKAYNPSFTNVYGSPQTVKGKKVVTTLGTSSHYTVIAWLNSLGMSEKDVIIQDMNQQKAIGALKSNYADVYGLWAPYTFSAEQLGLKRIASAQDLNITQPIVLLADKDFIKENSQEFQAVLKLYMKGINFLLENPVESIVDSYIKFYKEWIGIELTKEQAIQDLNQHKVFNLQTQLEMFEQNGKMSQAQAILNDIIDFYDISVQLPERQKEFLSNHLKVSGDYLKQIQ